MNEAVTRAEGIDEKSLPRARTNANKIFQATLTKHLLVQADAGSKIIQKKV